LVPADVVASFSRPRDASAAAAAAPMANGRLRARSHLPKCRATSGWRFWRGASAARGWCIRQRGKVLETKIDQRALHSTRRC
jgi:hypothetical protein